MLERFQVPAEDRVYVKEPKAREATEKIFLKMGLSKADATLSADVLMYADINGVDTHGVSNMLRMYVRQYGAKELNPRAKPRVVRDSVAAATVDGDRGLGLHVAPFCMDLAIEKAEKYGVGSVALLNSGHIGALGYFSLMAAKKDMIGMTMFGGGGFAMLPTWGAEPRFGTNPLAWAAPARKMPPFVFDVATTAVAGNKIYLLQRMDHPVLPGWLARADGDPIMQETPVPKDQLRGENRQWYMLPTGGTRENGSHKGYGLACVVDIMGATLSGNGPGFITNKGGCHFTAWKISAFTDLDKFKDDMDAFLGGLAKTKPAPGHDRVYYAGLPESEERARRTKQGIPYHKEVIDWFHSISAELDLGIKLP
jgi:LDH2 family malate/lactate/ureidoglycolate dehydrogenase